MHKDKPRILLGDVTDVRYSGNNNYGGVVMYFVIGIFVFLFLIIFHCGTPCADLLYLQFS